MIDIGQLDILTLTIFAPLVGAFVLAFIPGDRVSAIRWGALATSAIAFALSLVLVLGCFPVLVLTDPLPTWSSCPPRLEPRRPP